MMLNQITTQAGAHARRKRVGRGESSGHGKTCGRGNKGCQSRAGGGTRPLHEGGQMPIFRRLPKRGFSNVQFRTVYQVVNLGSLEESFNDGQTADVKSLRRLGLLRGETALVKVLGTGTLLKKLTVEAHAFSESAKAAIEKAGGTAKLIARSDPAAKARAKRNTAKKRTAQPEPASPG
jgi:large subunit ribosomal protein L15